MLSTHRSSTLLAWAGSKLAMRPTATRSRSPGWWTEGVQAATAAAISSPSETRHRLRSKSDDGLDLGKVASRRMPLAPIHQRRILLGADLLGLPAPGPE